MSSSHKGVQDHISSWKDQGYVKFMKVNPHAKAKKNEVLYRISIASILFLGVILRIYGLDNESIWLDEGYSIQWAKLDLLKLIGVVSSLDVHPPLYLIMLHYWIALFGDSEFSIRFLSTIFGSFSIFIMYKVGTLLFNKNIGVLSSLIVALSPFHIHYSQEARSYALLVILTLLSFYYFIRLMREGGHSVLIGYIVFSILLIYTHFYGLFIILAQNIYYLSSVLLSKLTEEHKPYLIRWFVIQGILVLLYTPWISVLITQIMRIQRGTWIKVPTFGSIWGSFIEYSGSVLLLTVFLTLSILATINIGNLRSTSNSETSDNPILTTSWRRILSLRNRTYLLLVWLLTPITFPFIISQLSQPIYLTRGTIGASLAFYLIVAKGMDAINSKLLKLLVISLVIFMFSFNLQEYYVKVNNEQWREVASYVDMNAKPGDLILFNAGSTQTLVFDYYSKRNDLIKKPFTGKTRKITDENIKELGPTVEGHNRVWLILSHSHDFKGLIKKTLAESYNLPYHKKYRGIDLSLFEHQN